MVLTHGKHDKECGLKKKIEWLELNASRDRHDLIKKFNETFNANITMASLRSVIHRFDLKLPSPTHSLD